MFVRALQPVHQFIDMPNLTLDTCVNELPAKLM